MTETEYLPTTLGVVPIRVRDRGVGPLALMISGAFPKKNDLEWLEPDGVGTAFLNLPGFHSPGLVTNTIAAFIDAFDQVIAQRFRGRPITVFGSSTGAIVASGLRASEIRSRVLVEPFLSTGDLWPFQDFVARFLGDEREGGRTWLWNVFGISPERIEDRNYEAVFRPEIPTIALVGDEPLMPRRPVNHLPSLTSEADRNRLRDLGVELRRCRGGHDLYIHGRDAASAALADALSRQLPAPAEIPERNAPTRP